MNPRPSRAGRAVLLALLLAGATASAGDAYRVTFDLRLKPGVSLGNAAIELGQTEPLLRELRLRAPPERYDGFRGDGEIVRDGDHLIWTPPADGGRLEYNVNLESVRANGGLDGIVTEDWALFRADDAFPPASIRQRAGSLSQSRLRVELPDGWSIVTPFAMGPAGDYPVNNPARAFDRPTGWLIAGELGRRKDLIEGMEVSIAAPVGAGVERVSMLALLRWTLPELARELGPLPPRLSVVSAGDPMWRGGLSAGNSVYIHAERPLLSENGTSTLLHEVIHAVLPVRAVPDQDWIDEGLAEYLVLRILRDSGSISERRFAASVAGFQRRGTGVGQRLQTRVAGGAVKARAVAIFAALDAELSARSDGQADLFTLVRNIGEGGAAIDLEDLRSAAGALTGGPSTEALPREILPARKSDLNLTK